VAAVVCRRGARGRRGATGSKSVIPDGLPPAILGKVRAASAAVADLHRAVTDELVARRPGRAVRHRYRSAGE